MSTALTWTNPTDHRRQYNASGVLEFGPCNTLANDAYSEVNTGWTKSGGGTLATSATTLPTDGPDVSAAFKYTLGSGGTRVVNYIQEVGINTNSNSYTGNTLISFLVKLENGSGTLDEIIIQLSGISKPGHCFLIPSGPTVGANTLDNAPVVTALNNSWYRVTLVHDFGSDNIGNLLLYASDGNESDWKVQEDSQVMHITGVQVRPENAPDVYLKSVGSAVYGARAGTRNRKPVTNLVLYPEQFDTGWTTTRSSDSSGQTDPFSGTDAFSLVEDNTAASTHYIETTTGMNVETEVYTFSCYVDAGARDWVRLEFVTAGGYCDFDVDTATAAVGTPSGLVDQGQAAVAGTNFYRCWITDTLASGTEKVRISIGESDTDITFTGDNSSNLIIFGANLTLGGIDSYIGVTNQADNDKDFTTGWALLNDATATANTQVAPDGTTTADTLGTDGVGSPTTTSGPRLSYTLPAAGDYNFSVFVKLPATTNTDWVAIRQTGYDEGTLWTNYDLINGVVEATPQNSNSLMEYYGNGWYRCSFSINSTSDLEGNFDIFPAEAEDDTTIDNDGSDNTYAWGAQLTEGADLKPYTGAPQTAYLRAGYTAEAAATNLCTDSEDFSAASWAIENTNSVTVTVDQGVGPDGLTTLDKIEITDTATETHGLVDTVSVTSGNDYVISCFVRADEARYVGIQGATASERFVTTVFDLYAGTVVASDAGVTSGVLNGNGIISLGNGLYSIWQSWDPTHSDSTGKVGLFIYDSASPTFDSLGRESYLGTAGDAFYAGGFQFETGTYPSSYIYTTGGTDSRSADATVEDLLAVYNASEGTLIASATPNNDPTSLDVVGYEDADDSDNIEFTVDSSDNIDFDLYAASTVQDSIDTGYNAYTGVRMRLAGSYKVNDDAASAYGATAVAGDGTSTVPTVTKIVFGEGMDHRTFEYYNEQRSDADVATDSKITDDGTTWRDEL